MEWRCVMTNGVQTDDRTTHTRSPGVLGRVKAAFADFFDPSLACTECGYTDKQRNFARAGSREFTTGTGWLRATTTEIEFRCPKCTEPQFIQSVSSYYPLF